MAGLYRMAKHSAFVLGCVEFAKAAIAKWLVM